jgi:hypothetical protein
VLQLYKDLADRDGFYRAVSRLPLLPGKSKLCTLACPDLIQHYRNLLVQKDNPHHHNSTNVEPLLQHPQTVELDSMLQLVLNCQQRTQYMADHRQVPEVPLDTGTPFNYLGIPVPYHPQNEKSTSDDDDDKDSLVHPYDWLKQLVSDQSPKS